MAIKKISEESLYNIKKKSAKALPDKPSAQGYSAEEIKNHLTNFVTDDNDSLKAEIDRIIDEINAEFESREEKTNQNIVDEIVGELTKKNPILTLDYENKKLKMSDYNGASLEIDHIPSDAVFNDNGQLKAKDGTNILPKTSIDKLIDTIDNKSIREYITSLNSKYNELKDEHDSDIASIEQSLSALLGGDAPEALNSIKELAEALNNNPSSIDDILQSISNLNINKVEKVNGKQLSTNDFTDTLKSALESLKDRNLADIDDIPINLSSLQEDDEHRLVTKQLIDKWNAISDFDGNFSSLEGAPTKLSQFENDLEKPSYNYDEVGAEASGSVERHNLSTTAHSDIRKLINEILAKVEGRYEAISFVNQRQLEDWISGLYTRPDGIIPTDLGIGQNIYLEDLSEPDYWVSSIPFESINNLTMLPTDKIDLSDYVLEENLHKLAFSGKYKDIDGLPTIPANLSDLLEDNDHKTISKEKLELIDANASDILNKLNKNLGANEANKMLVTDSNGEITTAIAGTVNAILDRLDSTDVTKSLSANQGRILNNKKLDKQQGVANKNKIIAVDSDGILKPMLPDDIDIVTNNDEVINFSEELRNQSVNLYNPLLSKATGGNNQNIRFSFRSYPNITYTFNTINKQYAAVWGEKLSGDIYLLHGNNHYDKKITFTTNDTYVIYHVDFYSGTTNVNISTYDFSGIQLEYGDKATKYTPYKYGDIVHEDYPAYQNAEHLHDISKNMFDINNAISGGINGDNYFFSSEVTNTSEYIEIEPNTDYVLSFDYSTLANTNNRGYAFVDSNKSNISGSTYNPSLKNKTFSTPENAKYIRFSYDKNCTNIQFERGKIATPYHPYGGKFIQKGMLPYQFLEKAYKSQLNLIKIEKATKSNSGITVTQNSNTFYISGTNTSSSRIFIIFNHNIENLKGTYTIISNTISGVGFQIEYTKNGSKQYNWYSDVNKKSNTLTFDGTETNFLLSVYINASANINSSVYLMVIEGNSTIEYLIPYDKGPLVNIEDLNNYLSLTSTSEQKVASKVVYHGDVIKDVTGNIKGAVRVYNHTTTNSIELAIGSSGTTRGLYSPTDDFWLFYTVDGGEIFAGHSNHNLRLQGSSTRPTYNNNDLALKSDTIELLWSGEQKINANSSYTFNLNSSITNTDLILVIGHNFSYAFKGASGHYSVQEYSDMSSDGFTQYLYQLIFNRETQSISISMENVKLSIDSNNQLTQYESNNSSITIRGIYRLSK